MAVVTELVTRFGFQGSANPLREYNSQLGGAVGGLAKMTAVLATATVSTVALGNSLIQSLKPLTQLSTTSGVAVSKIQALGFAAEASNSSSQALSATIDSLAQAIGSGSLEGDIAFGRLGINIRNANGQLKETDDILLEIADSIQGLDVRQQNNLISSLGIDPTLIGLLNKGSSGIRELTNEAQQFTKINKEQQEDLIAYQASIAKLNLGFSSFKNTLAVALLPTIKDMADAFGDFVQNNQVGIKSFIEGLGTAFKSLMGMFERMLPVIAVVAGAKGLKLLVTAIKAPIVLFLLAAAIIDDFVVGLKGGQSVIKDFMFELTGIDISDYAEEFEMVGNVIKNIFTEALKGALKSVGDLIEGFRILTLAFKDYFGIKGEFDDANPFTNPDRNYMVGDAAARRQGLIDSGRFRENQQGRLVPTNITVNNQMDVRTNNPERAAQSVIGKTEISIKQANRQAQLATEG